MEKSGSKRSSRSTWNPSTTVEEGSPVFTAASYMSPWFTTGVDSYVREEESEEEQRRKGMSEEAMDARAVRRSSSRGRERGVGELDGVAWDWRSRKWVGSGFDVQPATEAEGTITRTKDSSGKLIIEGKPSARGLGGIRRSAQKGSQTGRLSERELEGISEREMSEPRREGGQIVNRIRREKVGVRSRRRGYYVMDMRTRRKFVRRDNFRREINPRRSASDRVQGATVGRSTANAPATSDLSLQVLSDGRYDPRSFSLLTLEEYLKERASARQRGERFSSVTVDVGSPIAASGARMDEAYFDNPARLKYFEQQRRAVRRIPALFSCGEIPKLNDDVNPQQRSKLPFYAYEDAADEDPKELRFERSGCGMPWHWSSGQRSKDDGLLDYAGSCFPVSRRIGTKVISRSRPSYKWDSRVARYNSERSVSSFDSDMETVPLMTEPEPFHDYSDDLAASSVELDRPSPRMEVDRPSPRMELRGEFKATRFSRFRDDGRNAASYSKESEVVENLPVVKKVEASGEKPRNLSQKYRPKSFKDLVGQGMVAQSLSNAILKGKIAPVYLFQGPRGTGKTTAARIFTAALNCLTIEELRPCGLCKECTAFNAGRNFDVREVDAAGNNGVESMRLLLKHLSLPPSSSRYKVFIIDECHLLTAEAWNALLKSLEEPPNYVVFILITTDQEQLPRTAISRCQKFLFTKIKDADIVLRLRKLALQENLEIELEALQLIASRADGSLRDAETTIDQLSLLGKRVTLAVVRELVGLIPDDKLAELLDLALSPDTASTVKTIRQLMESGVEPLALISQLATLITDILAGKSRIVGYKTMKVRKDEPERLRQALRILSDAEKQLRSCSDRITWLTAAFLQFAPNDSFLLPSSLGTSVTQSPTTLLDTSEKETLELDWMGRRQSFEGQLRWNPQPAPQLEYMPVSHQMTANVEGGARKRPDSHSHHFSGPFADNKIYPCNQSPQSGITVKDLKSNAGGSQPPSVLSASSSAIRSPNQRDASYMSPCTMDNIWRKVLEGSRLDVLRQLSRGEGKLLSLSVTEANAIAHLEFRYPEHIAMAEKKKTNIANAFQVALGCPVEVKISLSSSQVGDNFVNRGDSPIISGNAGQLGRHKRMSSSTKAEGKAHLADYDNGPLQEQKKIISSSFRKQSSSFKNAAPVSFSPQSRTSEHRKSRRSFELEGSTYNRRSADLCTRDGEGSLLDRGASKDEHDRMMISNHYLQETCPAEKKKGVGSNREVQKRIDYSGGRSTGGLTLQNAEGGVAHEYSQDLMSGHTNQYSKGKTEGDSVDEPRSSVSLQENDTSNDVDKDSSDSETKEKYGPSLLCWKGTRINDGKVKHQRLRRRRRARFLLRLVPCAKEDGKG